MVATYAECSSGSNSGRRSNIRTRREKSAKPAPRLKMQKLKLLLLPVLALVRRTLVSDVHASASCGASGCRGIAAVALG